MPGTNEELLPTGIARFDQETGGLPMSGLTIVAARPQIGKTSLALNIARNAALRQGRSVAILSPLIAREDLATRLIAAEAQLPYRDLFTDQLAAQQQQRVAAAIGAICNGRIAVDNRPFDGLTDLSERVLRLRQERNVGLIVIDYLQIIDPTADNSSRSDATTAGGLKALASEHGIAIIALSQLCATTDASNVRPTLDDLPSSDALQQDADTIMLVHRPEKTATEQPASEQSRTTTLELIIGKNRSAPPFTTTLTYDHPSTHCQ